MTTCAGPLDAMLRSLVLGICGKNGHDATIEEARRRFTEHSAGTKLIGADLRAAVYRSVVAKAGVVSFYTVRYFCFM